MNSLEEKIENNSDKCHICGIVIKTALLEEHLATNHDIFHEKEEEDVNKTYKCAICSKSYTQNANLKIHIQTIHAQRMDYKCDICKKAFTYKSVLKNHMQSVHEKKRKGFSV